MIKFKNVTQKFADGTVAFRNLSFTVEEGELVLITGPSGSGKTTVMNLLMNEYQPNSGEIYFKNRSLSEIKSGRLPKYRRKIGIVFQDYKLIEELNVWENIAMPLSIQGENKADIEDRVTDLLKLVGLVDKALVFPRQLSGGEAQRISIARALATGPDLVFADEPTGNLDTKTARHIINLLTKINKLGTTLIIATHDPLIKKAVKAKVINLPQDQAESKVKIDKKDSPSQKIKSEQKNVENKAESSLDKQEDKPEEKPKDNQKTVQDAAKASAKQKEQQENQKDAGKKEQKKDSAAIVATAKKDKKQSSQAAGKERKKLSLPLKTRQIKSKLTSIFGKGKKNKK